MATVQAGETVAATETKTDQEVESVTETDTALAATATAGAEVAATEMKTDQEVESVSATEKDTKRATDEVEMEEVDTGYGDGEGYGKGYVVGTGCELYCDRDFGHGRGGSHHPSRAGIGTEHGTGTGSGNATGAGNLLGINDGYGYCRLNYADVEYETEDGCGFGGDEYPDSDHDD